MTTVSTQSVRRIGRAALDEQLAEPRLKKAETTLQAHTTLRFELSGHFN